MPRECRRVRRGRNNAPSKTRAGRREEATVRHLGASSSPATKSRDYPEWVFEPKFDGFRAVADTVRSRLISRNCRAMPRFARVLDLLPKGYIFDGELVVLDATGWPQFNALLFGLGHLDVAFDLLVADGVDMRPLPHSERKSELARIGKGADGWIALTSGVVGEGRALFRAVVASDLEGIVAKRLVDAYQTEAGALAQGAQSLLFAASSHHKAKVYGCC